jgi:hypothetical protein
MLDVNARLFARPGGLVIPLGDRELVFYRPRVALQTRSFDIRIGT